MADNDVKIKVSLDGDKQVQAGLKGIGDEAGKADSKLGGMIKGGLAGAGKALVGFSAAAVAAGSALAVGVVGAYAEYEQNVGGIETLFGDSANKMKQYAADAYKTAGLSANDYMSQVTSFSASLLQGLGGDTAKAADVADKAMVDMSDNANKFGSNITDIQNAYQGFAKQNFTMLDNLKLGYGGTREEMARLINDSGVMGDTFTATASNLDEVSFDKIIEGIHVVQDEMGIAGTTAKEASSTISGSIGMLKGSFDNLLVGLGSADADVASLAGNVIESLETVITNVSPVIENLGANMAELGPKLGDMMGSLVGAVSSAIPAILEAGTGLIGGLVSGISSALPTLIPALIPGLVGLVQMVAEQAPLLIEAGVNAIVALGEGIAESLPTLIPLVVQGLLDVISALVESLPMLLDVGLQIITALAQGLMEALPLLIEQLPIIIQSLVDFFIQGVPMLLDAGVQLLTSLVGALPEIITQIVAVLPQIITSIINAVMGAIPLLVDAGLQLITALVTALPEIIQAIVAAIPQIITAVLDAVLGSIPMLIEAGFKLITGLIGALPQIIGTIVGAIPQIIGGVLGAVGGSVGKLVSAGFKLFMGLIGNIGGVIGNVVGAVGGLIGNAVNAVIGGVGRMVSAGGDLVRGIWEGISGAAGWLFNKIGGFVNDVMGNIGSFFGIASPSKRMRDEIGAWLPPGIGEGVEENESEAIDPIRDMNKKIMKEATELPTLGFDQTVTQSLTQTVMPTQVPMQATATPVGLGAAVPTVYITGPLVSVDSMQVRNDQDIRRLSSQLKTDMTRELRAQGVMS
ncbi:tape measure protein [Microbacterium phage Finny]|uniref:Tape measure protein n=1 Tax=Microbacterium phage Finny TaxID=2590878 RepID=A0A4Y6ECP2_9CAUD|nr:tape measure protein [Microbacterium phage Finny]